MENILEREAISFAMEWAVSHGLAIKPTSEGIMNGTATHAPISLFPSPFPESLFHQAVTLQPILNRLVDALVMDPEFLETFIGSVANADPFIAKLYDIHRKVHKEFPENQVVRLAIMRMDYMVDAGDDNVSMENIIKNSSSKTAADSGSYSSLKMIEFNTMAASMGSHATHLARLHAILRENYHQYPGNGKIVPNNVISEMALSLFTAHKVICNLVGDKLQNAKKAVILFVIQEKERNVFDQRNVEFELTEKYGVICIRKTLSQLHQSATVDSETGLLSISPEGMLISVAYFRAGYTPNDFPGPAEWEALFKLESSRSVCCPTMGYQLVGLKKVQEILALDPSIMAKYLTVQEVELVQATFTGFHQMQGDSPETQRTLDLLLSHPERYVMKPQREGGGNNIYGRDIPFFLRDHVKTPQDRDAYIVMDLIRPPHSPCTFLRDGKTIPCEKAVNEIGIYGVYLCHMDHHDPTTSHNHERKMTVLINKDIGYLMRTKSLGTMEGGVAAGFAVIDTPLLFQNK